MKIEIEIPEGYYFDKEKMAVEKIVKQKFNYVDLGLPSGTLWADCNVGAKKDTGFGDLLTFDEAQKYDCPSKEQLRELLYNTKSIWITKDGVNGYLFIGKNGNYIFLPTAGARFWEDNNLVNEGSECYCWSSSDEVESTIAINLSCNNNFIVMTYDDKDNGCSVRTVKSK